MASSISSRFWPRTGVRRRTALPRRRARKASRSGCLRHRARDQHLARDAGRPRVVLEQELAEHLVVGHDVVGVEEEHVAPEHLAVAHDEQLDGGLVVLAGQGDEVQLRAGERGHLLALHRPLDRPDLVPDNGRLLVLLGFGGDVHLVAETVQQDLGVALEEQLHLGDVAPVGRLADRLDARALAALDVVQQAGPGERADAVLDLDGAGPEREEAPDEVHRLVNGRCRRVRSEVARAVAGELPGALDAREVVAQGDLDVRVALVVLEPDVEPRPEPLDEVGLEEQRLGDRVHLGDLEVGDPLDRLADLVVAGAGAGSLLLPVAPDPAAKALGLAHVQDLAARVLHQVHARPVRESRERCLELRGHGPIIGGNREAGARGAPASFARRGGAG